MRPKGINTSIIVIDETAPRSAAWGPAVRKWTVLRAAATWSKRPLGPSSRTHGTGTALWGREPLRLGSVRPSAARSALAARHDGRWRNRSWPCRRAQDPRYELHREGASQRPLCSWIVLKKRAQPTPSTTNASWDRGASRARLGPSRWLAGPRGQRFAWSKIPAGPGGVEKPAQVVAS